MIQQKPAKVQLKAFKNKLIESRTPAVRDVEIKIAPNSLSHPCSVNQRLQINTSHRPQQNYSQSSTLSQKRLKLKDYIYLNSLEKRGRSGSVSSQSQEKDLLKEKAKSVKMNQQEYVLTLKKEIEIKMAKHRTHLEQIDSFLKQDFTGRESKQTFLFLFSVYNSINDMEKMDRGIGDKITEFEAKRATDSSCRNKEPYFWRREKQLNSPAKILKNALKITFDLTNFLQMGE